MNQTRRLVSSSSSFLRLFTPVPSPCYRLHPAVGIRFASRGYPRGSPGRQKPPPRRRREVPADPKDSIEGWPEYKEQLLKRCKTPDEVAFVQELDPEDAMFLVDPTAFENESEEDKDESITFNRLRPVSRNYFSGDPVAEQFLQDVEKVYEKFRHLPKAPAHLWPIREWRGAGSLLADKRKDYGAVNRDSVVATSKTRRIMLEYAKELNQIHPVLQPPELRQWLDDVAPLKQKITQGVRQSRKLNKYQLSRGSGKRKTSNAAARIVPGEGLVYVNGRVANEVFTRLKDVQNVIWPLQ